MGFICVSKSSNVFISKWVMFRGGGRGAGMGSCVVGVGVAVRLG